jgi:maltose phosphorylase
MDRYFSVDPWQVTECAFDKSSMRVAESVMSTGNGAMGLRGNFEEDYSGDTLLGTYVGGVWFPDKTRVGWWKIGYPVYFGKVINFVKLIGLHVRVNGVTLDAAKCEVYEFSRTLDMRRGVLSRNITLKHPDGKVSIHSERFVSMAQKDLLALRYTVIPSFDAAIQIEAYLDGNVRNEDSNYSEVFWDMMGEEAALDAACICVQTVENPYGAPRFMAAAGMSCQTSMCFGNAITRKGYCSQVWEQNVHAGAAATLCKMICVATDRDMDASALLPAVRVRAGIAAACGFDAALREHEAAWAAKWSTADVRIEGDDAAQQGIRFNLFQLLSTYTGEDDRLNIGPKGFTGEKYGGAAYWDTEAYCLPVYLAVGGGKIARQLLMYRYRQLDGAYRNAARLGLPGALYPMVTFTGDECHNEWEITFEEIHRNGAIAHAIFEYTAYTGDDEYARQEGLPVLVGIARFWAGRVHRNERTDLYMIHGVTGPNEYENNVSNNWYTNRIASWCLEYCCDIAAQAGSARCLEIGLKQEELLNFKDISSHMYLPEDKELGIFVQHDTFMDKELIPASAIVPEDRPINQHWSWDRILRSCFIKQADVLQGLYFLGHLYDKDTKRRNFDFYEPMTVHESSLSPCVHAVLAAELGYYTKAEDMYRRTARLDLDNINHDTQDGLHITSMSGSWLAIAQGFAGMRTVCGLSFFPYLPDGWKSYTFRFIYRDRVIKVTVDDASTVISLVKGEPLAVTLYGKRALLEKELIHARKCNPAV